MGTPSSEIITIDGGVMEGGGQILRMAMAFSTLLRKPIRVTNIRAGRSNPGLRPQHLTGLQLVRDLCGGRLKGGEIGSTDISFYPGPVKSGEFVANTGTAGSVMLLFQVAFPCLLFGGGPSRLSLRGGTNAEMAPQIDYTLMVFKPILEKFGVKFDCNIVRRGYYPKGGGEVVVKTSPVASFLQPVDIVTAGQVTHFSGRSFVAGVLPIKVAHAMADSASRVLRQAYPGVPLKIDRIKEPSEVAVGNGSGIVIMAETSTGCLLGGSALGRKGESAEKVGEAAAKELLDDLNCGGCVDHHLQDQLIIFMALAKGESRIKTGPVTLHTETAIYVVQLLTEAKFNLVKDEVHNSCIIECQGIGLQQSSD
ncbi:RNA 3'-terminal phosphate cyclase-like isoform X1 [Limulus polyphemus]|uniref:RNA 3'-terminal phosphate cyclase n=1 Tax=Limulus polyphemus TaxID=6850 RepID=A0ABM1BY11_LIMPO|nr:RNA 3'-terminal phosphate cyclase-like isoform X1 [Limulus polyphemus]